MNEPSGNAMSEGNPNRRKMSLHDLKSSRMEMVDPYTEGKSKNVTTKENLSSEKSKCTDQPFEKQNESIFAFFPTNPRSIATR
jgi:hypothetical protein